MPEIIVIKSVSYSPVSMNASSPLFSVIVVAHDRRTFLREAIASLATQTIPRDMFEVIIVKNYEDKELDSYSVDCGFINCLTDASPVGAKISIGIGRSSGQYFVFLEDDDLFKPEKLATLSDYIRKNRAVSFIQNSFDIIGSNGKFIRSGPVRRRVVSLKSGSFISVCLKNKILPIDIGYSSCISIRRDIMVNKIEKLNLVKSAPDFFTILSFVNSCTEGLIVPEQLTLYRLHESHSNRAGELKEFLSGNIEIRRRWVDDYELMRGYFREGPAYQISSFFASYNELFYRTLSPERSIIVKCVKLVQMLKSFRILKFYSAWSLILLAFVSMLSPGGAHRFYYSFRSTRYFSDRAEAI